MNVFVWIILDIQSKYNDYEFIGSTITVMSPDGKPIQVNASSLQAAAAQNTIGRYSMLRQKDVYLKPRIGSKN